jgi:hypothetical protein
MSTLPAGRLTYFALHGYAFCGLIVGSKEDDGNGV